MQQEYLHIYLNWSDPTTGRFYTHRSPLESERGVVSVTLGRGRDNSIKLASNAVSVKHARIEYDHGSVVLTDLNSLNGTWVSGRRLAPWVEAELSEGDELCFGGDEETWHITDGVPPGNAADGCASVDPG